MTVLIFHALTTPERRPIQMGARLYDGAVCVSQLQTYIRPDGWTLDADPQTVKLAGRIGAPLPEVLGVIASMSKCAADLAFWDVEEVRPLLAWARDRTWISIHHEAQRKVDLRVASKPLVPGDHPEGWLPTMAEAIDMDERNMVTSPPAIMNELEMLYRRLQHEGLI
jgi:hypothetical protein